MTRPCISVCQSLAIEHSLTRYFPAVCSAMSLSRKAATDLDLGRALSERELRVLELGDRATERLSLLRICDRVLEDLLDVGLRHDRHAEPLLLQLLHEHHEAARPPGRGRFSAGMRQSSNASSAVSWLSIPIFSSLRLLMKPGRSASTRKSETLRCGSSEFGGARGDDRRGRSSCRWR